MRINLYEELVSMSLDQAIEYLRTQLSNPTENETINISEHEFNELVKNGFLIGNQGNCIIQNFYAMLLFLYHRKLFEPKDKLKECLDINYKDYIIRFKLFHLRYLKHFLKELSYSININFENNTAESIRDRLTELLVNNVDICLKINQEILGLPVKKIDLKHIVNPSLVNIGMLGSHSFYFVCLDGNYAVFDDIGIRNYLLTKLNKQYNYPKFKYELIPIPILEKKEFDHFIQNYTEDAYYGSFLGGCYIFVENLFTNIALLLILIAFVIVIIISFVVTWFKYRF
jgi:hypothetical protein